MTKEATGVVRSGRPIEVELKYRPSSLAAGERYLEMDEIAGLAGASRTKATQLEDRYVDTADGALARAGFAARLRLSTASTIVSVKSIARRASASGAHRREELEGPADPKSSPRDWAASDARSLILELGGDAPLRELVTIRQLRRKREFRDGETVVEVSLDEVEVVSGSQVVDSFVELEVELVRGSEASLARMAQVLGADGALTASGVSKLEAALGALRARAGRDGPPSEAGLPQESAPKAARLVAGKTPGVTADDHLGEAGRKVLRFHLARMLARESGTRSGADPEDLHAMRVATRRMRAAWRVFGDAFRPGRTRQHRSPLRELAGRLGAVRDLDVLIEGAEAWRAEQPAADREALDPLLASWRGYRDDARVQLVRELDSDEHARFAEAFRVFVQTEGAGLRPMGPTDPHHVRDTAPSRVLAAHERVRAYEPVLRWADVETLHQLRIAAKWLRYTLEFFREALGPEVDPLLPHVIALQDHLGALHDADVASSMARTFLVERGADLSATEVAAVERFLASRDREVAELRGSVGVPWRAVTGLPFRRRLGRAIAVL
jgi:CHAD domain-containing protein